MKSRTEELKSIVGQQFDLCVIGGGATGAACALDAQLRGIRTVLVEAGDYAGATSSAATKIIHGGVRYLEEAIKGADLQEYHVLVRALHERVRMLENAPHLTRVLEFLVPSYRWVDVAYLDIGLKTDLRLAGGTRPHLSQQISLAGRDPETYAGAGSEGTGWRRSVHRRPVRRCALQRDAGAVLHRGWRKRAETMQELRTSAVMRIENFPAWWSMTN